MNTNSIKEISERLGVSTSTVSRALSGQTLKRKGAQAQADEIRKIAQAMGYTTNNLARSLKTNHRQIVGLIVPNIQNEVYTQAANIIHQTLTARGYRLILCVTNEDHEVELAQMRVLYEERVAGIILVSSFGQDDPTNRPPDNSNFVPPIVELIRQSNSPLNDVVLIDDVTAGYQSAHHLLAQGHRHIAVVTGHLGVSQHRLQGYRQAFAEAGVPVDESLIRSVRFHRDDARAATLDLLEKTARPTALIATSGELVIGVLQGLKQLKIRVPEELSVMGFGDPDWFALLQPPLTTLNLPIEEMARVATNRLFDRIKEAEALDKETAIQAEKTPTISRYQAHLVIRESTRVL